MMRLKGLAGGAYTLGAAGCADERRQCRDDARYPPASCCACWPPCKPSQQKQVLRSAACVSEQAWDVQRGRLPPALVNAAVHAAPLPNWANTSK